MMAKNISIKWRLFSYFSLFSVVTLLLLWIFQVVFLDGFYKFFKTVETGFAADNCAQMAFDEELEEYVESLAFENQLCILVLDEEGEIVASADTMPGCCIHKLTEQELRKLYEEAAQNNGKYTRQLYDNQEDKWIQKTLSQKNAKYPAKRNETFFSEDNWLEPRFNGDRESLVVGRIASSREGEERFILLNAVITPVSAVTNTLKIQLLTVTLIMLLLSFLIALAVTKTISRPIMKINSSAKELVSGNYKPYEGRMAYREVSELDKTLNEVSGELKVTENLRKEFLSNISHDLRTPLTMIKGYSEMIRDIPGENTPENLQIIIDEVSRLNDLVNDLFALSKLQSGNDKLKLSPCCLTDLIEDIVTRYIKMQPGLKLEFHFSQKVMVSADPARISQVLYNLIDNAFQYGGKDKKVRILQTVSDGIVKVEVCDEGQGIPPEEISRIWDRYYRLAKNHTRTGGTGLGLSIVSEILKLHQADYGVESQPGEGSTFWFSLKILS